MIKSEEKVFKGYWWRPMHPEKRVAGVLTYNGEKIILELIGSITQDIKKQFDEHKEELIYGIDSNAKEITLIDCYPSISRNFSSEFPLERYTCRRLVYDKYVRGLDEKRHYAANIFFPELPYWAHPKAIKHDYSAIGNISLSFSTDRNVLLNVDIDKNVRLELVGGVSFNSGEFYLTPDLNQKTWFKLNFDDEVSISEIERYMRRLSSFLSLAFLSDVHCSRVYLTSPENVQEFKDGQKYYHPIDIYWPNENGDCDLSKKECLFGLNEIASNASSILKNWICCSNEIWPIMNHLVDSLKRKPVFSSVDFLIVIQAIEGFWWRFRDSSYKKKNNLGKRDKTELKTLIKELLNEYGRINAVNELSLDIDATTDSRHYYSHFLPTGAKQHVKDGIELYNLTSKLRILLLCIVLTEIGFTDEQVDKICCKVK